jgi:hypothetical protein
MAPNAEIAQKDPLWMGTRQFGLNRRFQIQENAISVRIGDI